MVFARVLPDQAYAFPAIDLDLKLVRTNLPPRTIVRGPGFINSVMIIEQAGGPAPFLHMSRGTPLSLGP